MRLKIAIGTDHRGFELKAFLLKHLSFGLYSIEWFDQGCYTAERTDYPIYAHKVAQLVQSQQVDLGILACGTGVGMAITANRYKNILAGLVWNETIARLNKEDDNINILVLPADYLTYYQAFEYITIWLSAEFKGGRYASRIAMIDADKS